MLTPGQYTHHPGCPHLIATLQRVVDEVSMPMWMPGPCSGTTPIPIRGPGDSSPRPPGGGVPDPIRRCGVGDHPPDHLKRVQALGYHQLGDLYTEDHHVKGECALKERAPARKGIPGLSA